MGEQADPTRDYPILTPEIELGDFMERLKAVQDFDDFFRIMDINTTYNKASQVVADMISDPSIKEGMRRIAKNMGKVEASKLIHAAEEKLGSKIDFKNEALDEAVKDKVVELILKEARLG